MACLEWLGAALIKMGGRSIPSACRYDREGELRLVVDETDFDGIADAALNQIRQYGAQSVGVIVLMLDMISRVAEQLPRATDRATLLAHAEAARDDAVTAAKNKGDKQDIENAFVRARDALTKSRR